MTNLMNDSVSGAEAREPIAVFLLDDHEVVRRGVRDLLEAEPDIMVVGEAGTASSALAASRCCGRMWPCWTCGCRMATGWRCAGRSGPGCPRWRA